MKTLPLAKNQDIELFIEDLGAEGQGVGRYQGYAVFIPGALQGEQVRVRIIKAGKAYGVGKLLEAVSPSEHRTAPACDVFGRCGGCTLMHLSYDRQLVYKQNRIKQALIRIGKLDEIEVLPTLGMEHPWRYRNKAAFCAGQGDRGSAALGLYAARSHRVVPVGDCMIEQESCAQGLGAVLAWMREYGVSYYDETTRKGLLRHVIVRTSSLGEVMVILCTNGAKLPGQEPLVRRLRDAVQGLRSIAQCVNARKTNVIMDGPVRIIWGADAIREQILGLTLALSPRAFFQVNPSQAAKLYAHAISLACIKESDLVLDAYCGIGAIGLLAAKQGARVVGVEIVEEAVRDARINAELNRLKNIRFICAKAEEEIPGMLERGEQPDVVILDPPRKGCDAALLQAIADADIGRIVYISCNPATFARDLAILADRGYTPGPVQPVDMFPHTAHVECAIGLRRKD
ncbi:MAG: 23S rRNA (uracil(1939)-C(5))-methyltransferase RlmD [Bacillota bacterium]